MQFGRLAGNDHINRRIYDLLAQLHPEDVRAFVRKFRADSDTQNFHTFRELILGVRLRSKGCNARYGHRIAGRTPDWSILAPDGSPSEVIDVVTLHQRRAKDIEIGTSIASDSIWSGWITIPPNHLLSKLEAKANTYSGLAEHINLPYVLAAFSEFTASIDPPEVHHVLHELYGGLFSKSPWLSGVIFFREQNGVYEFTHFPNPHASRASRSLGDA